MHEQGSKTKRGRPRLLDFLSDSRVSQPRDFWSLDQDVIPQTGGVYILIAGPGLVFQYPHGRSAVFYIGMARNLRSRLRQHLTYAVQARSDRRLSLYWPRYEYAARFAGRYAFIKTWQGMSPRALEDEVLARFAARFRSFPVANGAGSWWRVQ